MKPTEAYVDGMLVAYEDCAKLADDLATIPEDFLALAEHDFRNTMLGFAKAVRAKAAKTMAACEDDHALRAFAPRVHVPRPTLRHARATDGARYRPHV
jgi:hypothetical protein